MLQDKQFLFIIGAPRSGTTWLQLMIGAHPCVCTTVELTIFSAYTGKWVLRWKEEAENIKMGRWTQGLPTLMSETEFYGYLRGFIDDVYTRVIATKPDATHILDKHPGYSGYVEDINLFIPTAKFIHIIRDGRDVASSMISAKRQIGFGTGTIDQSAKAWSSNVLMARKARIFRDRYLEVRYEDLITRGEETLKAVFDFCGLAIGGDDIAKILSDHHFEKVKDKRMSPANGIQSPEGFYRKGKTGSWKEDLSSLDRYLFHELAGSLLEELGYAENGWWAETPSQRYLLPLQIAFSSPARFSQMLNRGVRKLFRHQSLKEQ